MFKKGDGMMKTKKEVRREKEILNAEIKDGFIPVEALDPKSSWYFFAKQMGWLA